MRVGVDATSWVNRRGYGRFARNSVWTLVECDRETTYVMYIDAMTADQADFPSRAVTRRVELRRAPSEAASANSSRSIGDLLRLTLAVRRDRPDVFLFPSNYTYFPVIGTPSVVGIHDAIPSEFPDLAVPGARARLFSLAKERVALARATRLFTVSEASRRAISSRLHVSEERLTIVPLVYARIARNVWRRGHAREFVLATPLLALYLVATAIGEGVGYVFGGGRSLLRVR